MTIETHKKTKCDSPAHGGERWSKRRIRASTSFTGRVDPGAGVMRVVFGLGALMTWLFFFALAYRSLKLLRGDKSWR